jgi:hypothetical protein
MTIGQRGLPWEVGENTAVGFDTKRFYWKMARFIYDLSSLIILVVYPLAFYLYGVDIGDEQYFASKLTAVSLLLVFLVVDLKELMARRWAERFHRQRRESNALLVPEIVYFIPLAAIVVSVSDLFNRGDFESLFDVQVYAYFFGAYAVFFVSRVIGRRPSLALYLIVLGSLAAGVLGASEVFLYLYYLLTWLFLERQRRMGLKLGLEEDQT